MIRHRVFFCFVSDIVLLLELPEELLRLEVLRDGLVESRDDLVNLLLPTRLGVFAVADRKEEFAQRRLNHR